MRPAPWPCGPPKAMKLAALFLSRDRKGTGARCVSEPRPPGSPHGRAAAAKGNESRGRALVGRPFLAASRLSCRLSGRTFNGAGALRGVGLNPHACAGLRGPASGHDCRRSGRLFSGPARRAKPATRLISGPAHHHRVRAHRDRMRGDAAETGLLVHGGEFAQRVSIAGRCRGQHGHAECRWHRG